MQICIHIIDNFQHFKQSNWEYSQFGAVLRRSQPQSDHIILNFALPGLSKTVEEVLCQISETLSSITGAIWENMDSSVGIGIEIAHQ